MAEVRAYVLDMAHAVEAYRSYQFPASPIERMAPSFGQSFVAPGT